MKREIFFDLSTISTGYAIYEDQKYIRSGHIDLDRKMYPDGLKRAHEMLSLINSLLIAYPAQVIYVEKATFTAHRGQELTTYIHGGFRFLALTHMIDCFCESTPTHWRKVLGFDQSNQTKNDASKKAKIQSLNKASEIAGKTITDHNEADAICLGMSHYIEYNKKTERSTYEVHV